MYSVPKQSADPSCHGKFKKLSLKVETKMVPQRKKIPFRTKFNKVQNISREFYIANFLGLHVLNLLLRTGQKYWKEATPGKKTARGKNDQNFQKEGGNGFQSNGSCGFLGGLGVSTISQ
jgi:hypothetical protein